jgi:curved DNA-binding protein CbpA
MVDYYASLHVLPSADADVIKAAFRVLARRYHPDSCAIPKEDAHRRMQEINAAYEVLGDEQKRAAYDRDLAGAKAEPEFDATGHERDVVFEQDWQVACKYCPKAEVDFETVPAQALVPYHGLPRWLCSEQRSAFAAPPIAF